ncbi:MAG: YdcF family protein [Candidatus Sulfobium sp.]
MFAFKKLITPFLLPPGVFIAILIVSGLLFLRKSRKAGVLCIVIGAALWLLSTGPVSDALMRGLEAGLTIPSNPRGDVIVLLGGGVYDGVKDLTGVGAPSEDTLVRVVTVVRLQRRLHIPVIVSGGAVFPWRRAEAPVDRRFLMDLGVPGDRILVDDKSRDTFENARYVKKICEKYRFKNPILVTSAYHMRRSLLIFRLFNMEVTPVPAGFRTWDRKYGWTDYLPGDLEVSRTACREYIGLLYYETVGRSGL